MKRFLLSLISLLLPAAAGAQTYLVNAFKPTDSRVCEISKYTQGTASPKIYTAGEAWYGGFVLGRHYLVKEEPPFATFNIGGKYDKLTFVMGPSAKEGHMTGDKFVVTVRVDGRKVLDEVVSGTAVARRYTLDVKGVNEVTFAVVNAGCIAAFGEVALWTAGQTPRPLQNPEKKATAPAQLLKDIPCYYSTNYMDLVARKVSKTGLGRKTTNAPTDITINGVSYTDALLARMDMAIIGNMTAEAHFNLRGQYETLRFVVGTVGAQSDGSGWVAVSADGKNVYEKEWHAGDVAEEVTLSIAGCKDLRIWTENDKGWAQRVGFARMMVYPKGMEPARAADAETGNYGASISRTATIDPKLKALPDVCPLMSSIKPYSRKTSVEKQVYDGTSDHLTFSMGGTRFSEGFVLIKRPWFFDESTDSNVIFDLGNEFDYITFTAGFIGKSWYMNKDVLRVYADDTPVLVDTLYGTMMNRHYTVPINKCRTLRFECRGYGSVMGSSAFGCADLVLFRGEPRDNNLFTHTRPDCPDEIDLIDLGAPYIHFMSAAEDKKSRLCLRGETLRDYYTLPTGEKIHKGFVLQTSSHFSLDAGVLGVLSNDPDDPKNKDKGKNPDAMASAIGAAAVGTAFVPIGAVGSSMVGATLNSAAAFMVIAAGGTAVESSCAAFNAYGQYNSLTFKVACLNPSPGLLADKLTPEQVKADKEMYDPEQLLIGSNGQVIAELSVFPAMEPQTVTLPIEGAEQLMFFLANTHGTSAIYVFYDLHLSKQKTAAVIPGDARAVKPHITEIPCNQQARQAFLTANKWERPKASGAKDLDAYITGVTNLWEKTVRLAKEKPDYAIETFYLEQETGDICKAVRLKKNNNVTGQRGRIPAHLSDASAELKALNEAKQTAADLTVKQGSAALDLPSLGLNAISYGKIYKRCNKMLKACRELINLMHDEKKKEVALLRAIDTGATTIEGQTSTEQVHFLRLQTGETVPPDAGTSPLKNFRDTNAAH